MTRVAIVSTTHGRGHGAEVVLGELLRAWHEETLPLTVLAPPGSAAATMASAARVRWVPFGTSRDAIIPNMMATRAATPHLRGIGLVHAWSARALEPSWWIGRRLGVTSTATLHDHPDAASRLRRRLWRVTANLQEAIAFPSAALESAWRGAGFSRRSQVIPNGLHELGSSRQDSARDTVVIGFVGMHAAWKGFDIVSEWARREWPNSVRWAFFGEASVPLADSAAALAAELGTRARFEGQQPRERIFPNIDILAHCSTSFDPFPTVLLEAANAGVPVVASGLGGAGEIVVHRETGYLFDPGAPEVGLAYLRNLVSDRGLRARLGAAARTRFDRLFLATRMADGYADFWNAALSARHRDPADSAAESDRLAEQPQREAWRRV